MVSNNSLIKHGFILFFMLCAVFAFAQKVGDKDYKLVSINGEKVYRWMDCIEVVEYYENGNISNFQTNTSFNAEYALGKYNHEGARRNIIPFSEDFTIVYKSEKKCIYDSEKGYIPVPENWKGEIVSFYTERWFKDKKIIYEKEYQIPFQYNSGRGFFEYDQKGNLIKYRDDWLRHGEDFYEVNWDSKGNVIFYTGIKYEDFSEYGSFWFEYDNQKTPIRYFSKQNGWEKIKGDEYFPEVFEYLKKDRKEIMNIKMPEEDWTGTILYTKNYDDNYKGGIQFEYKNNQLIYYNNNGYEEYYEYDAENREINYKMESEYTALLGNKVPAMIEEHYEYNSKGNKIRYNTSFLIWKDEQEGWEKGTFNTKGNKSHFTDSLGNEGYYFYEYYPSGAVKIRRKFKYLTFKEKDY